MFNITFVVLLADSGSQRKSNFGLPPSPSPRGPLMQDKLHESPQNFKRAREKCLSKDGGRLLAESARGTLRNYIRGACTRNSESRGSRQG